MKSSYVQCKIAPGLFDSEWYVQIGSSSAYVPKHYVRVKNAGLPDEGEVRAYVVEVGSDEALIELSGEPVVGGLRTWVPKSKLVA